VALRVTIPRGVRVAGQIAFQNGNSREALPTEIVFGGPARGATAIAPDGTFEFAVVTPGKYQAELRPHPSTRMPKLEIEVRAEDLTGLRWVIPDSANVNLRALLESSDPLDQAWAGWTAGEARRTDMIPLLEKALVSRLAASAAGDRENVAIDTISDALIRLDAKLDLATIRSLYSPRPAQALVLLSRMDSSVNGFLFELLETQQGLHWFATANLLLKQKTPGLAASLVKGMRVEAHVSVCDPGRPCASVGGGMSGTGSRGYGHLDNYPPWPGYILSRDSGDLLARGPTPVFVQREVALPGTMPRMADGFQSSRTAPTTEDRIAYVRVLAPGARAGLSQREDRIVEWKGREALDAEIDTFLDGISTRYSMMLQDLLAAGVLTKQEAEGLAKPPVTLVIDDRHTVR
jgi:hypothetical protein